MGQIEDNQAIKEANNRINGLSTLVQLEREIRQVSSKQAFFYHVVNESNRLIDYDQGVLWLDGKVQSVSSLPSISAQSPLVNSVDKLVRWLLTSSELAAHPRVLDVQDNLVAEHARAKGFSSGLLSANWLWVPIMGRRGARGGLLVQRAERWRDNETELLSLLADTYRLVWEVLAGRKRRWGLRIGFMKLMLGLLLFAIPLAMFIKVPLSALAPAEVAAIDPMVVSSPYAGVIKQIEVEPNQEVKQGELLFTLDDTELRNRFTMAEKSLAVVQQEYQRSLRQNLAGKDQQLQQQVLQEEVVKARAERAYMQELLQRTTIYAPTDGVAIFSDKNDWHGKPVVVGEQVMQLASLGQVEVLVHLPVDDAIAMHERADVSLFLNVAPLQPLSAKVRQASYVATTTPDGYFAYRLRATLTDTTAPLPRIGLKGTARITGEDVTLFYYLFRKPLSAARRWLGL